jgi:uncharacterized protein (TIGR00730 family)
VRVAVFTGSASGPDPIVDEVRRFAQELARAGVDIVYGGGRVGLMGVVADAALAAGGQVIGVMPGHLVDRELAHRGLSRFEVVADMHERKARMAALADAFIALPGGAGTLEEIFEAWTWSQLGLHQKPVALLNIDGFFDALLQQLDVMAETGFLSRAQLSALGVAPTAAVFLHFVASYQPPPRKWRGGEPDRSDHRPPADAVLEQPEATLTSVGWICLREGQVLAVRSHGRDRFYLPGGKVEAGETLEQALVREVREELSLELTQPRAAFSVQALAHGLPEPTELTMHCFYAEYIGEPRAAGEIAELCWIDLDDTVKAAPAVQEVLRQLAL